MSHFIIYIDIIPLTSMLLILTPHNCPCGDLHHMWFLNNRKVGELLIITDLWMVGRMYALPWMQLIDLCLHIQELLMICEFTSDPLNFLVSNILINISWKNKGRIILYIMIISRNDHGTVGPNELWLASTLDPTWIC